MERLDHCVTAFGCQLRGKLERLLEVLPMDNELRALRGHRAIFLFAVAMGNHDQGLQSMQSRSHSHALTMVASRGRNNTFEPRLRLLQPVHVDQCAAQLERSNRGVILVLQPGLGPEPLIQQRPGVLRRRRHVRIDNALRLLDHS